MKEVTILSQKTMYQKRGKGTIGWYYVLRIKTSFRSSLRPEEILNALNERLGGYLKLRDASKVTTECVLVTGNWSKDSTNVYASVDFDFTKNEQVVTCYLRAPVDLPRLQYLLSRDE